MKKRFGGTDRDNRGMSLIEIIIVVAIMSTMIGVVSFGLSLVSGKPAEECAKKLASVIQHTRTITMGKNMTTITIYMDAEGRIAAKEVSERIDNDGIVEVDEKVTIVGDKGVKVVCYDSGGGETEITGSNKLELSFDRGSGALKKAKINGVDSDDYCTMIVISKANKTKYIVITQVTGKLSIQNTP